jgi:hypothetical protein
MSFKPPPSAIDTERVLAAFEDYKSALNQTVLSSPIKTVLKVDKRSHQIRADQRQRAEIDLMLYLVEDGLGRLDIIDLLSSYRIPAAVNIPRTLVVNF